MHPSTAKFLAALAAVLLALALLILARLIRRRIGIPDGKIVYSDHGQWGRPEKSLYDSTLGLTGKPDYLLRRNEGYIPVEVKSMWAPRAPYDSHRLQLGAYCALVEGTFGKRPPYGLLRYRNRTFKIAFTEEFEEEVLEAIKDIRSHKEFEEICRSHEHPNRCARCGFREHCDQRL